MAYCGNNEFVDDVVIVNNMCDNGQGDHTIVMSVAFILIGMHNL